MKIYVTPDMKITEFEAENIITTSNNHPTQTPILWDNPTNP